MLLTILIICIGLLFSVYGVSLVWAARENRRQSHKFENWQPILAPLQLETDKNTHLTFVAVGDFEYSISLILDGFVYFNESDIALIKLQDDNTAEVDVKDFEIYVEEEGNAIVADGWWSVCDLILASFKAHEGKRYEVTIISKKAYPELAMTKPQAEADIAFWTYKNSEWHDKNQMKVGAAFFLVGLGLVLLGWWRSMAPPLRF